jgi:catechol 2,3-dioxygenase-like lactoylglutathione lyase family enzyme
MISRTFVIPLLATLTGEASADLGPCRLAAPTTTGVMLIVSDIDRSARWYRDHAGLAETARSAGVVDMARGPAGVTLIEGRLQPGLPQMVCLVLDGPPAPAAGSDARYLTDPDGTGVELPPRPD